MKKKDPDEIGNRDVGRGVNFYSLEKEIALGKQMATEVERSAKVVDDPVISEYVNRIGQNLVRNSDAKAPFAIKVLDSDEVNAFALPGGFFFVNTGLILKADNEAELAGVMAHEIAHVAARHGTPPGNSRRAGKSRDHTAVVHGRPEYVVTTSEFEEVRARLAMLENRRRIDDSQKKDDRPTLRRRTSPMPRDSDGDNNGDQDKRPTLKRRS